MQETMQALRSLLSITLDASWAWLLTSGVRILFVLVASYILLRTVRLLTDKLNVMLQGFTLSVERQKRAQTLSQIVRVIATTVLFVVSAMLILSEVGLNLAPLLAAAGIGGLAIGFGAQNLVRDVITGFFMLLEDHIRVGDVVKVGDQAGVVENITLRVLTLRDLDGSLHVIPHSTITTVTNMTKDFSFALLNVGVAYREDVDEVITILKEIGTALRQDPEFAPDILDDLEILGVDEFAASQITIKIRLKTAPIKQWRVAREFRRRMKKAFDARGVEIPFPHLTLYLGESKQGDAPPLRVALDSFPMVKHVGEQNIVAKEGV
jgi:small-conductance mechanosensitive channel